MAKRGENIYKRKDGRWEGRYIKNRHRNGKIHYGYVYAKTYRDLKQQLEILKVSVSAEKKKNNVFKGTLGEWLDYWLENIVRHTVKISTYNSYKNKCRCHLIPLLGDIPLNELKTEHLEVFVEKIGYSLSSNSIHTVFRILKTALNFAFKQGYFERSVYEGVILPKRRPVKMSVLSIEEQKLIINTAAKNSLFLPIAFSLETGMRVGEISGLKWADIDFKRNVVAITRTLQRVNSGTTDRKTSIIEESPKTISSERTIPLSENLLLSLIDLKRTSQSSYVFSNGKKYLEPRTINYRFKKLLTKLNLPDYKFHTLRHTFATRCLEQGVNITTISALLGHSSAKMTLDVYTSSSTDEERKAIKKITMI